MAMYRCLGMLGLLLLSAPTLAWQAGDLIVRTGAIQVTPQEHSDPLRVQGAGADVRVNGTRVGVDNDTQLSLGISYLLSDHLAIGVLAATPFQHALNVRVPGIYDGDLGDVKHLPPTFSLQWFPAPPSAPLQPYLGIGLNYTTFFQESAAGQLEAALGQTRIALDDSLGLALELGLDVRLGGNWLLNVSVWHIDIATDADIHYSDGSALGLPGPGRIRTEVELDPWVYQLAIGYRF